MGDVAPTLRKTRTCLSLPGQDVGGLSVTSEELQEKHRPVSSDNGM